MHKRNLYNFISSKRIRKEQNNSTEDNKTTPTSRQSPTSLKNVETENDNLQADRHDDRIRYENKYRILCT